MLDPHRKRNPLVKNDSDAFERLNRVLEMSHMADEKASSSDNTEKPHDNNSRRKHSTVSSDNSIRKNRLQQQKSTQICDDRDHSQVSGAISFKSWQSRAGVPTMLEMSIENEGLTKDVSVRNSNSDNGDGAKQHKETDTKKWSNFLDRVNEKEKEKRRVINAEAERLNAKTEGECFFSPNLTTKSLKMAASYDPLKERIPRILTAREIYLEQQRCILLEKEIAECSFSPQKTGETTRSSVLTAHSATSLCDYEPYVQERKRKDEDLRSKILEIEELELTFQPKTNAVQHLKACAVRRQRQMAAAAVRVDRPPLQDQRHSDASRRAKGSKGASADLHPVAGTEEQHRPVVVHTSSTQHRGLNEEEEGEGGDNMDHEEEEEGGEGEDDANCLNEGDSVHVHGKEAYSTTSYAGQYIESSNLHSGSNWGKGTGIEVDNCHERLYQQGMKRNYKIEKELQRRTKKDFTHGSPPPAPHHSACERLYRDGLSRQSAVLTEDKDRKSRSAHRPSSSATGTGTGRRTPTLRTKEKLSFYAANKKGGGQVTGVGTGDRLEDTAYTLSTPLQSDRRTSRSRNRNRDYLFNADDDEDDDGDDEYAYVAEISCSGRRDGGGGGETVQRFQKIWDHILNC